MPSEHATLSPSASARWLSCPASVRLAEKVLANGEVQETSVYAEEGTKAHSLAELEASLAFGKITEPEYRARYLDWVEAAELDEDALFDMTRHAQSYVQLLQELADELGVYQILFEQRLDSGVPQCWGTSDAVILGLSELRVVDFKYGQGIAVSAHDNSQLMLYALGALDTYGELLGDTETVHMTIYQPRLDQRSTAVLSAAELRAWRTEILPVADQALHDDNAPFGPSDKACRFCPAAGECTARMEAMTDQCFNDDPDLLTPAQLGDLLATVPSIRQWCADVEAAAFRKAFAEHTHIPGWKLVMSGGVRYIPDAAAAIQTFIDAGYRAEQVATFAVKRLGELEKLVGKKELPDILGDLLVKRTGKPTLVPEADKRPTLNPEAAALAAFDNADKEE